jgi:two-component system clock-associated histidine kinase SasA
MVAHELRTPLTAAKLALQSFNLGQIDQSKARDVLGRRLEDIEQLSKDLLEVGTTRWEALFNPQRLNLGAVAAEAILELEKLWIGRGLELVTDIPTDLPDVYADQRRMRQVLLNLLENALKFTPDGGRVSLHDSASHQPVAAGERLRFGPGHPQGGAGTDLPGSGCACPRPRKPLRASAVGLSVCRRICDVHGGRIWVVSEPGEGACFHFTVPVWDGQSVP